MKADQFKFSDCLKLAKSLSIVKNSDFRLNISFGLSQRKMEMEIETVSDVIEII